MLVTGEGADELFGGYGSLHAAALVAFLPWRQRILHRAEPVLLGDPLHLLQAVARLVARRLSGPREAGSDARPLEPADPNAASWIRPRDWDALTSPHTGHDAFAESITAYAHHAGERRALEAGLLSRRTYTLSWLLNAWTRT